MDRFTRNYSIILGLVSIVLVALVLYEDPAVRELNQLLEGDAEVAGYPYTFRVLEVKGSLAKISTPRTYQFPVQRALGIIHPHLAGRAQDDPQLMQAQADLAHVQKRVQALIQEQPGIERITWSLDREWLMDHGVIIN